MTRWLVAVLVLINAAAWWQLDGERSSRLAGAQQKPAFQEIVPEGTPRLLLLTEATREPVVAVGEQETSVQVSDAPEPAVDEDPATVISPPEECWMLGGTSNREQLERWQRALRADGIQVADGFEITSEEIVTGYRVYVPVGESAQQTLQALQAAGIEALLVADSREGPQIAVGLFTMQANAQRQQQRVAALGHGAHIAPRRKVDQRFWVTLTGRGDLETRAKALLGPGEVDYLWRPCTRRLEAG